MLESVGSPDCVAVNSTVEKEGGWSFGWVIGVEPGSVSRSEVGWVLSETPGPESVVVEALPRQLGQDCQFGARNVRTEKK